MRSLFLRTVVTAKMLALSASAASAQYWTGGGGGGSWTGWVGGGGWGGGSWGGGGWSGGGSHTVPEIDASSGMLAVVALSAVLLFALERRRQTKMLAEQTAD